MNRFSVAIVGSGPSGCYAAQALRKQFPNAEITVLERLPVPFGLLRYGVAADHQGTKAVQNQFENLFARQNVGFVGGLSLGDDVTEVELLEAFDAVVLATGTEADRMLAVSGDTLPGVIGAGRLTRALNSHPAEQTNLPIVGQRVAVIGSGNVAVDIIRILCKRGSEWDGSDIDDEILSAVVPAPIRDIHVFSRALPAEARWDAAMIRELSKLSGAVFALGRGKIGDENEIAVQALTDLLSVSPDAAQALVQVTFHFGVAVERVVGGQKVEALSFRFEDQVETLDVDTVITAIGFDWQPRPLQERTYATGWLKTGPRGTIPSQRILARELVSQITADLEAGRIIPGRRGVGAIASKNATDFSGWNRVKQRESAAASDGRVRRKIRDETELRSIAKSASFLRNEMEAEK